MEKQIIECHRQYYQQQLPRLYHMALYLLGERAAAQQTTEQVWRIACTEGKSAKESVFLRNSMRMLIDACRRQQVLYQVEEVMANPSLPQLLLLQSLGAQPFSDRVLLVLWAALGIELSEIAQILLLPEWMLKRRLNKLAKQLCTLKNAKEHVFC
ncbi:MAG: hypothetical protein HFG20_11220 [Anaerotruncus sp.]|nr:hypothetical protein [Anaerotruncus sp.]